MKVVALYTDGGVIRKNPSPFGGTWAWCGVDAEGNRVIEESGYIPAPEGRVITNNHTEQIAIVKALEAMPEGWNGTLYSDSNVAIGRVFDQWATRNLPTNIIERAKAARARLGRVTAVLLQGHPTRKELADAWGSKRNLPVSEHNVWCDTACRKASESFHADAAA